MLPNYIIIGAPRCATDFLFYNLGLHKDISIASKREIHFFDKNFEKGINWYSSFFQEINTILLEKTANYFVYPLAAKRIKQSIPNAKLILSLRNPIERAFSFYKNWVGLRICSHRKTFRECIQEYPRILTDGNYFYHLSNYLDYFDIDDIFIVFFEDLLKNTNNQFIKIYNFLNICNDTSIIRKEKKNEAKHIFKIGKHILSNLEITFLRKILGEEKSKIILKRLELIIPDLSIDDRKFLYDYYYESNNKLFQLLDTKKDWL